jgi:arsenate reductase
VDEYLGKEFFGYVAIVCSRAAESCPTAWPGVADIEHMYFDDPAAVQGSDEEKLAAFRATREAIRVALADWIAKVDRAAAAADRQ